MERLIDMPDMPGLEFDETPHIYRLDGVSIPSVTTIMEPLSMKTFSGVDEVTLNRAADRGTAIHNSIENILKFDIIDTPTEYMPYVEAFVLWREAMIPDVVGSEIRLYHKMLQYAGTCDLLCYIDDELNLIDYKTSYAVHTKLCAVQLEAYSRALESHGVKVDRKRILHLRKDGSYKIYEFPINDAKCWRVFGALKTVYDYACSA